MKLKQFLVKYMYKINHFTFELRFQVDFEEIDQGKPIVKLSKKTKRNTE